MCRALLCGDDSSHSQSQSGKRLILASRGQTKSAVLCHGSCIDPTHQSHTLDLTSEAPILRLTVPIQLLIKDVALEVLYHIEEHLQYRCISNTLGTCINCVCTFSRFFTPLCANVICEPPLRYFCVSLEVSCQQGAVHLKQGIYCTLTLS